MLLKAGLNVKVVLFPIGEDPDSYAHQVSNEDLKLYLTDNQIDFISFKTNHLIEKQIMILQISLKLLMK